jgi:hypothetical protein
MEFAAANEILEKIKWHLKQKHTTKWLFSAPVDLSVFLGSAVFRFCCFGSRLAAWVFE